MFKIHVAHKLKVKYKFCLKIFHDVKTKDLFGGNMVRQGKKLWNYNYVYEM